MDGDSFPSGTTGVTCTAEGPSLHWVLWTQPNLCLHFGWLKFGLIRSPLSSAFHLGKLRGAEYLKSLQPWSQKHPHPYQIFKEVSTGVFPVPHHGFSCIYINTYIYKYIWIYILRSRQIRKTNKQKIPETNGEWKKFVKELSWSLICDSLRQSPYKWVEMNFLVWINP